ncbi:hypothetical protein [Salinisphaera sp.]|uniref:hypothetical protein n=1 Tax=Salinisphaera sp. TaxID=1914330 RepID=UPI002D7959B7|nr:hypothetical protein [Salinisphaera sp.]HET7315086.1 hypothetical protein [Salinisphaera sp.]
MNIIDTETARPNSRKAMSAGVAVVLAAVLGGCAGSPNCLETQRYEDAKALPKLKAPAGLSIPKPDPDMRIPDVPNGPVAAYRTAPQGTDSENPLSRCLITPPPINTSGAN